MLLMGDIVNQPIFTQPTPTPTFYWLLLQNNLYPLHNLYTLHSPIPTSMQISSHPPRKRQCANQIRDLVLQLSCLLSWFIFVLICDIFVWILLTFLVTLSITFIDTLYNTPLDMLLLLSQVYYHQVIKFH